MTSNYCAKYRLSIAIVRIKFPLFPVDVRDTLDVVPSTKFVSIILRVLDFTKMITEVFHIPGSYLCVSDRSNDNIWIISLISGA